MLLKRRFRRGLFLLLALMALFAQGQPAFAYSVMSHQAIIDSAWEGSLKPTLLERFPNATPEELSGAQAYAYGGAIIQDMGYYPFGSHFFSDLTHYVRSGDFILALLRDSRDLNEYAFALGALAHYAADNEGHSIGTNLAVPMLYPHLREKYGTVVTYEQDKLAHIKTEFGFDVLQVAKERYAPTSYHDFIGFEVSGDLLGRAFHETYGLDLGEVLGNQERALNSYRNGVSKLIPSATRIAWSLKQKEIQDDLPGMTKQRFLYNLKRANFEKEWGKDYQKPTLGETFLAFMWRLLPKIGPLKILQFKTPTPETERMFQESFNATLSLYRRLLKQQVQGQLVLPNDNFDVGEATGPGKYAMNDEVQAKLLDRLAKQQFRGTSPELRSALLQFFDAPDAPYALKHDAKTWAKVQAEVKELQQFKPGVDEANVSF